MVCSTTEWLKDLGLEEFADIFARNRIDHRALVELNNDDLRELDIPLGPRKLLLKAISELRSGSVANDVATLSETGVAVSKPHASSEGERRQLTVMFCDLVGSTALSARMDPEEFRDILTAYRSAAAGSIRKYAGLIANYLGDGLLVYFGYPQAHEDDAERAVRAGLDLIEEISLLSPPGDVELKVRIGIATGLVVAGDVVVEGASEERAVLGDTPNLAARLQAIAGPNEVIVSKRTRDLVTGRVILEALEPQKLKGIEEPAYAYRAIAIVDASRFGAALSRGLSAMSGRESEIALLRHRWEQAKFGEGQTVLLSGEPGIGKSRLSEELRGHAQPEASGVLDFQCSPFYTESAFHPIIDHLRRTIGFVRDDPTDRRQSKLESFVAEWLFEEAQAAPLLAAFLSLPNDLYPALDMTPQRQKAETMRLLVRMLDHRAAEGPLLVVFEDAHWIDPSSQEFLTALIESMQSFRMLCLITTRPEFSPHWAGFGHVTALSLNRLGRQEGRRIVESVAGNTRLPSELIEKILERTDGIPLFVEEMTKAVIESAPVDRTNDQRESLQYRSDVTIPATLQDLLIERLDRLGDVKEVAQTASCIGREFSFDLLARVGELRDDELRKALDKLLETGLLFRQGSNERAHYQFKHALVQDAAYETLLVSKRRRLHTQIASVLETRFAQIAAAEPERVAQHYTLAELPERAIPHWLAAGNKALSGSSLLEANAHLAKALDLIPGIEDPLARATYELDVRTALGAATMALYGWPAPQVRGIVEPACDLFEQGHGGPDAFMNLWNLWVHHGCRAEHHDGIKVVERMFNYSDARDDRVLRLVSSFAAAMANLWVGNYEEAESHERDALEAYEFDQDRAMVWQYNHDPKNTLLSWASHRVWSLGYPDKALNLADAAVAHARKVGHPFNLCWTLGNSCITSANCGDYSTATARIHELRQIARDQELVFIEAYMASSANCLVSALQGGYATALRDGAVGEEIWHSVGGRFWSPIVKAHMALACLHLDKHEEAQNLASEAIEQIEATGEFMLAEEVYRIAGLASLYSGADCQRARSYFEKSLDFARKHGTKSYELRTLISLAQLYREQGKRNEAFELLAPVYEKFDEGFDTADLRKAANLLSELS